MKSLTRHVLDLAVLSVGAAILAVTPTMAKDWTTVTIATEAAYEPWNLTTPDGKIDGFEPELLADLCARMKVTCKLIPQDWDGMIAGLTAGKFDVIMDALSVTDERKKTIAFTTSYANTPATLVVQKDSPLAGLPDTGKRIRIGSDDKADQAFFDALRMTLKGKAVGVQGASNYDAFLQKYLGDSVTIREYKTAPEHDLDLLSARIDAVLDDSAYFATAFEKAENKDLVFTGPLFVGGGILGDGEAFGLRQSDGDLVAKFDESIKAALADGTVKRLSLKWFKLDVTP